MSYLSSFTRLKLTEVFPWLVKHSRTVIFDTHELWRAKYVTCKNAKLTPFWHWVGVCMVLCYAIDYKHLYKKDGKAKYH